MLLTVLVVDDDATVRAAVSRVLRARGFDVDTCNSGEDALELLRKHSYRVVLLDFEMSGLSGAQTCKKLRAAGVLSVIVMHTADLSSERMFECFDAGADDYVQKGIDLLELEARLRAHLRREERLIASRGSPSSDVVPTTNDPSRPPTVPPPLAEYLTRIEERLLRVLRRRPGFVGPGDLKRAAWGGIDVSNSALYEQVSNLRDKVARIGWRVENFRGLGYRLIGDDDSDESAETPRAPRGSGTAR